MSRPPLDIAKPGPAGMWLDARILTPDGLAADRAARTALETYCDLCGTANAGNGYGSFSHSRGVIACDDPGCRQEARERVAEALRAPAVSEGGVDLFSGAGRDGEGVAA